MNNEKRDEMIAEIHGDVKTMKSGYDEHSTQLASLFKAKDKHAERITVLETTQKTCPALAEAKPARMANKLLLISIIVVVILGLLNLGVAAWGRISEVKAARKAEAPAKP